ncbi:MULTISPECIES: DNA polymerase III subunit alpha [Staphylococcus]|uniref:DNA polymerase III subunit alpha n=1 Tax=Staphylococcus TaxID=1279 RepID=UPI0003C0B168|nr:MULTISPECIES: DNA polymerase III subunit alpha [Staphylococcus]QAV31997.1 DNA polymerase III subunit alpha [Sulfitobacter donghicola]AGZ24573.1 DNA polymerase III subunit alpha [Staphylococcus pasteuri SP1]KAB7645773.1 DNA polymerase III subunit alpha [Staphylococcus sp. B2-b]MBN6852428.1 DNA polymerase III subunit alpha [Staphylococcus warneri]MBX7840629.1 DNA polymerase III subunit alpha [Staphylococcus warneri]
MVAYLNIHTSYDLLNSSLRISDVVKKAKNEGIEHLAITDTNVLYGYPKFYDACLEAGIHPVFGMTVYLTDGLYQLETVLLAQNNEGLKDLYQLSSAIKMKEKEDISIEWLKRYANHLVIIFKSAEEHHLQFIDAFNDKEHVYLNQDCIAVNQRAFVWLNTMRYLNNEDADTISALQAIKENSKLDLVAEQEDYHEHVFNKSELRNLECSDELIFNTDKIAQICTAELNYHQSLLPQFQTPNGETSKIYLWQKLEDQLNHLNLNQTEYWERLKHEYDIITNMGFEDYFLIVSDLIHYAKTHDVMVGPGRGSSAGSLVSYLLGITTIDPIRFNLLFERFLNPERVTMPDIDIDFEDTRREKVIQYVQEKYGQLHVSGIVTFGHLLARAVARDVGRIMGFDEITLNEISKLIPHKLGITLEEAYQNDDFKQFVHRNYRHERWFEICKKLEGLPRHTSTHAAGIIINDHALYEYAPLTLGDTGLLTQWTMTEAERIGLLKIDFLGLRNLSIIHQIINQVKKDLNINIEIERIPFDDPKVFELLSQGDTTGIFQLESDGVRSVLKKLKPEHFEDIVAVTSLYRPGPMEEIPTYITRRHDPSKVEYLHKDLAPILKNTYGVIIYQEQIMQIASQFANFSYGEADILRRAMSKKNRAVLESERQHFVDGAKQNGYDEYMSKQIFDLILKFADYGFPRAHAVSYSKIAYIMSYLKVHYPNYFYANILSNVIGSEKKTAAMIDEAKHQSITILPPNINESHWFYKATNDGIYLSLGAIKGVGYQSVKLIVDERYQNGDFKDFFDFARRLPKRVKTRKLLESLILVGAFDIFGKNRATLLHSIDQVIDQVTDIEQDDMLFDFFTPKQSYEEKEELPDQLISEYEKEYLGFYISKHPVEKEFNKKQYLTIYKLSNAKNYQPILVQFDQIKRIRTKNGQNMAFVTLNDGIHLLDGVIFPNQFKKYELDISEEQIYVVQGKFDKRNGKTQLIINDIYTEEAFESLKLNQTKQIIVRKVDQVEGFYQYLDQENTNQSIEVLSFNEQTKEMSKLGYIKKNSSFLSDLVKLFKPSDIRFV